MPGQAGGVLDEIWDRVPDQAHTALRRKASVLGACTALAMGLTCLARTPALAQPALQALTSMAVRWTMRWKPVIDAFAITFSDRCPGAESC